MTTRILIGLSKLRKWGLDPSTAEGGRFLIVRTRGLADEHLPLGPVLYAVHENRWGKNILGACDAHGNPLDKTIKPFVK